MINKKVATWIVIGTAILFTLAVARAFAYGTTKARPNSLGVSEIYQNNLIYILALPLDGKVIEEQMTNIRLQPFGTPQLYDESLLLCGDVSDQFAGKKGVLVLAYERQAHRMYRDVGCHELRGVFEVKEYR